MDVIKEKGTTWVYDGSMTPTEYFYSYIVWCEGFKLAIGSKEYGKIDSLVEFSTHFSAVTKFDFERKPSIKKILAKFEEKLNATTRTLSEVVRDCFVRCIYKQELDVCVISLLKL